MLLNRQGSLCPGDRPSLIWSLPLSFRRSLFIYLLFFGSKRFRRRQGGQPCPFNQDSVQQSGLAPVHGTSRAKKKKEPWSQKSAWPSCWKGFASSSPKARLSSGHQWVSFWISHPQWSSVSTQCSISLGLTVPVLSCVWSMRIVISVSQQMPESGALRQVLHFRKKKKHVCVLTEITLVERSLECKWPQRCNLSRLFFYHFLWSILCLALLSACDTFLYWFFLI